MGNVGDMTFEEFNQQTTINKEMEDIKWEEVGGEINPTWNGKDSQLKEGDTVQGRYVAKKTNIGRNKSNVYVLETDDKKIEVWGSTVIDARMDQVAVGKMVKIVYKGTKPSKNFSQPYKDYAVYHGVDYVGDGQ